MNKAFQQWLKPIDAASLGAFRFFFGAIMLWQTYRYFEHDWIGLFYIKAKVHFKYYGFSWVHALPGDGMYWVFGLLGLFSFMVMIGLFYRFSIIILSLIFTYIFLLDEARYLNHFYLVILFAFLLCFVDANRAYALDTFRKKYDSVVPQWQLYSLRLMMEIMLIFAGLVKIQQDWLNGLPLSLWLSARTDTTIIGSILDQHWVHLVASYFSIGIHLLGAPLLLFKKTRFVMFCIYGIFHGMNSIFFNIGIFPILTLAATTVFFDPNWPRRFVKTRPFMAKTFHASTSFKLTAALLIVFFIAQILLPLRHYLYPGDVMWTDEGHKFAWRMKLREKNGTAAFYIRDPDTGRQWTINNTDYLLPRQIVKVATRPDLALQFAHFLAETWRTEKGVKNPDVRAWIATSLNDRTPALLVNPSINLTTRERSLKAADWIYPSEQSKPVHPSRLKKVTE